MRLLALVFLLAAAVAEAAPKRGPVFTVYGTTTCPAGTSRVASGSTLVWIVGPVQPLLDSNCYIELPPAVVLGPPIYENTQPGAVYTLAPCALCR